MTNYAINLVYEINLMRKDTSLSAKDKNILEDKFIKEQGLHYKKALDTEYFKLRSSNPPLCLVSSYD